MYIPKTNLTTDKNEIVSFMKQFSFATIITAKDGFPIATHLPFLVTLVDDSIVLTSHFAKANEQWKDIKNHKVLVIFSEPHAYISTTNYDKKLNVPTWNYISIHAYGQGKIVSETKQVLNILEASIDNYEVAFREQWDNFPEDYKLKMSNGIVAFEILVNELQAKKKLSQNRSETEKKKIIDTLSKSNVTNERLIAQFMQTTPEHNERFAKMTFASVYPLYLAKVERKGRTKAELHQVIQWLTGFNDISLRQLIDENVTFKTFFERASLNPKSELITGTICGYKIEEIENPLTKQVRYLDKLVDELAKGKKMEKILRA